MSVMRIAYRNDSLPNFNPHCRRRCALFTIIRRLDAYIQVSFEFLLNANSIVAIKKLKYAIQIALNLKININ